MPSQAQSSHQHGGSTPLHADTQACAQQPPKAASCAPYDSRAAPRSPRATALAAARLYLERLLHWRHASAHAGGCRVVTPAGIRLLTCEAASNGRARRGLAIHPARLGITRSPCVPPLSGLSDRGTSDGRDSWAPPEATRLADHRRQADAWRTRFALEAHSVPRMRPHPPTRADLQTHPPGRCAGQQPARPPTMFQATRPLCGRTRGPPRALAPHGGWPNWRMSCW